MTEILSSISDLPTFPQVAMKVLRIVRDPAYTTDELTAAISLDSALTARMLKLCNSSYYGLKVSIGTVQEAVVYLGQRTILNLVLVSSASDMFKCRGEGYLLDPGELWRHSVGCALGADMLARRSGDADSDQAFTAAIFHDLGKVVLNEHMRHRLPEILTLVEKGDSFIQAETKILGVHHGELGALLVEQWNLPKELASAIRYHHEPSLDPNGSRLPLYVHVSDILCLMMGIGAGADGMAYDFQESDLALLGLKAQDLPGLGLELKEHLGRAQEFLEI